MEMRHDFGGNVVSFVRKSAAMSFPAISQVDAYWEGLRDGRLMPERSEIDPRGIESALEFAFMLEQIAPGVARIRVAGMHLNDLMGMEVRGMPFTALFEPASRGKISELIERVLGAPQVADIRLSSDRGIGRPNIAARLYMAPLNNGGHGFPRIFGCLQSAGDVGRAPRRFSVEQVHVRRIVAAAGHETESKVQANPTSLPVTPKEFAEPSVPFTHKSVLPPKTPKSTRPRLRLVKTDE